MPSIKNLAIIGLKPSMLTKAFCSCWVIRNSQKKERAARIHQLRSVVPAEGKETPELLSLESTLATKFDTHESVFILLSTISSMLININFFYGPRRSELY
jgi:hypothetical protein